MQILVSIVTVPCFDDLTVAYLEIWKGGSSGGRCETDVHLCYSNTNTGFWLYVTTLVKFMLSYTKKTLSFLGPSPRLPTGALHLDLTERLPSPCPLSYLTWNPEYAPEFDAAFSVNALTTWRDCWVCCVTARSRHITPVQLSTSLLRDRMTWPSTCSRWCCLIIYHTTVYTQYWWGYKEIVESKTLGLGAVCLGHVF